MDSSDDELVQTILAGDIGRFAEIVGRYDARVRAVIRGRLGPQASIEEVVQETFYLAFRSLETLRVGDALESWLVRIAERRVLQHLRSTGRREAREAAAAKPEVLPGSHATWIWEEVAVLPLAAREVLELRYRIGLDLEEIANRLQVPHSTIRGRLYEARAKLRHRLMEKGLWS